MDHAEYLTGLLESCSGEQLKDIYNFLREQDLPVRTKDEETFFDFSKLTGEHIRGVKVLLDLPVDDIEIVDDGCTLLEDLEEGDLENKVPERVTKKKTVRLSISEEMGKGSSSRLKISGINEKRVKILELPDEKGDDDDDDNYEKLTRRLMEKGPPMTINQMRIHKKIKEYRKRLLKHKRVYIEKSYGGMDINDNDDEMDLLDNDDDEEEIIEDDPIVPADDEDGEGEGDRTICRKDENGEQLPLLVRDPLDLNADLDRDPDETGESFENTAADETTDHEIDDRTDVDDMSMNDKETDVMSIDENTLDCDLDDISLTDPEVKLNLLPGTMQSRFLYYSSLLGDMDFGDYSELGIVS
jgi:hypothetical protein